MYEPAVRQPSKVTSKPLPRALRSLAVRMGPSTASSGGCHVGPRNEG